MMAHTQVFESESETETETYDSDDSQQDPSFHILEETRSKFSDLSIKKKPSSRVPMELDEEDDCTEITVPKLDANEEKSFEIVQKIIEDCQVEKLKVEQCKLYLRRHGLRLTGKKDILIERIKEHIRYTFDRCNCAHSFDYLVILIILDSCCFSIINGEGEHKYPASTFVMNCKGDACTGDIVMFEQNVYEM
ncbi:putative transcription regulator SAP family [Helianthus debilis subsp. tardiflorus]